MNTCCSQKNLTLVFRDLWTQHVIWTRLFIISTLSELNDLKYVTNRLLRNPNDFAKVLCQYYGRQKAKKFQDLLTEHLMIGSKLVNAAKDGKTDLADDARKKWYVNAGEIACFLASINCFWSQEKWEEMLHCHLKMIEAETNYRIDGLYEKDIAEFDDISAQALQMGDYMAMGMMKQFYRP
ncbi:acetylglutamate kinase [Caproicibacterium lactatifermentans]|uniref:Acetylglutamate kinase n=1 Tax=Caproicibacterium lactatifermentans TaxID=2666138 RepID=A0A859DQQ2_9FIRM|nr:acetylglutamate kinase [Caproicibacterium lactatifermentans]QKN24130.1 acetylglutamate kinase [Caproicibacterium lactatifermentans]